MTTSEEMPPFPGGAVGFFGYDLVRTVEPLGEPNPDTLGLPDMALMVCELMLAFDHLKHELSVIAFPLRRGVGADSADRGNAERCVCRCHVLLGPRRPRTRSGGADGR